MINIAIDTNAGLVYEYDCGIARPVHPAPVITPAKFIASSLEPIEAHSSDDVFGYRFREDSFDPISRIRRGRFYLSGSSQGIRSRVTPHPAAPIENYAWSKDKQLDIYYGNPIWHKYIDGKAELPIVLLGVDNRFTAWSILSVEAISTGEDLVTLKARDSFGILPELDESKVPEEFLPRLKEAMSTFVDEVHRSSPTSVIDRARDLATQTLLAYLKLSGNQAKDLGDLIKRLDEKHVITINTASIIARLHARAKPVEQERRGLLPIREEDAALAQKCVASLLREVGFADWK